MTPSGPDRRRIDPEEYAELVLSCAELVPPGRVTTYGAIAEAVGEVLGGGGPRQVGSVMALHGGSVPWWRVVRADGSLPPSHDHRARQAYLAEGTPLRRSGIVDLRTAFWRPALAADATVHHGSMTATYVHGLIGHLEPFEGKPRAEKVLTVDSAHVVVFEFAAGQRLNEHAAHHPVIVQAVSGRVRFSTIEEVPVSVELGPGDLIHLPSLLRHEVEALEDTTLTVTMLVTPPAGSQD